MDTFGWSLAYYTVSFIYLYTGRRLEFLVQILLFMSWGFSYNISSCYRLYVELCHTGQSFAY